MPPKRRRRPTFYETLRERRKREVALLADARKWRKIVGMIREHPETVLIGRDEYKGAWSYVEDKFPSISSVIRSTKVYKNENTAFCRRIGVPKGAGGLFFVKASVILVCYNPFDDDVVIVHEMLHYASQRLGSRGSASVEEDFAYATSIPYLLDTGRDADWIARVYLLPYYLGQRLASKSAKGASRLRRSEKKAANDDALEYCNKLVANALHEFEPVENQGRDDPWGRFGSI